MLSQCGTIISMRLNNDRDQAFVKAAMPEGTVEVDETDTSYTKESLAAIADEGGIGGLRAIAEPMNVKGTSIVGLIDAALHDEDPATSPPLS